LTVINLFKNVSMKKIQENKKVSPKREHYSIVGFHKTQYGYRLLIKKPSAQDSISCSIEHLQTINLKRFFKSQDIEYIKFLTPDFIRSVIVA
jgi:hypothetical protein